MLIPLRSKGVPTSSSDSSPFIIAPLLEIKEFDRVLQTSGSRAQGNS